MDVELSKVHPRSPHAPVQGVSAVIQSVPSDDAVHKKHSVIEAVPRDDLQSAPAAPSTAVSASTPATRRLARFQFATLCWTLFLAGWNDGTTGPLLQRIQTVYHVNFALVSLIFVFNCLGFVIAATANMWLTDRLGFGKVMIIGSVAQIIGYVLAAPAPPFPVFVMGYFMNGLGIALQDAGANSYVASIKENTSTKMGILHAIYGAGAFAAPLVATEFAQLHQWSFHYLISFGIAVSNTVLLIAVFRFKDQDTCLAAIGQAPSRDERERIDGSKYKQMFQLRALHLIAFFILIYIGVEVTLGGWIVTYVKELRGGGPSSGYIASGFFGGLTVGRIGLLWVNHKVGERRAVFLYAIIAVGLELVVWLVPSLIGGGIAISLVGVLLGPIYPIVINHSARVLPPWLLTGCIGWISGFGQAGSAFLPFVTGALANKVGIKALQPLLVSMMGLVIALWALVPGSPRRSD